MLAFYSTGYLLLTLNSPSQLTAALLAEYKLAVGGDADLSGWVTEDEYNLLDPTKFMSSTSPLPTTGTPIVPEGIGLLLHSVIAIPDVGAWFGL